MKGGIFSLFDMAIAGIPALVFTIWQYVSVSREIRRDREKSAKPDVSPESARHPVGQHRLNDRGPEAPE